MNRVLASTVAVSTACVLPSFLLGAMAVQVRGDLGFGESGTGLSFAAFFLAAALASAPAVGSPTAADPCSSSA